MIGSTRVWVLLASACALAGAHAVQSAAAEGEQVFEASVFSQSAGDPVTEDREWVELGTLRTRAETVRGTTREVSTNDVVPCPEGECSEIRRRSDRSFSVERAADARGTGFASTTQFALYIVSRVAPQRTVTVDAVRQPWQQPPPGAGPTARLYEIPSFSDSAQPGDQVRIAVDDATGLPVVVTEIGRDGRVDGRLRWSYSGQSRSRSELPPDFFRVPEPEGARDVERVEIRTVEHGGAEPRRDAGTGRLYRPTVLRPGTKLRGKEFCFRNLRHEDTTRPMTRFGANPLGLGPGDPLRWSSTTVVHTVRRADGTCSQRGVLEGVWVVSTGRGGQEAALWASQVPRRFSLQQVWRAAGRKGRVPGRTPQRPVFLRREGAELTFIVATTSTVIVVSGPFGLADVPRLVAGLQQSP